MIDPAIIILYNLALILCIILIIVGISIVWTSAIGAPWVPTPGDKVRKMLELAKVDQNDTVIDMGSGDGRIIIIATEEFGADAIGIEADPLRVLWSRIRIRRQGLNNKASIIWGNFYNQDLSDATVITIYQFEPVNNKLKPKFTSELKPGTRIVSYSFPFKDWTPTETAEDQKIYLYII